MNQGYTKYNRKPKCDKMTTIAHNTGKGVYPIDSNPNKKRNMCVSKNMTEKLRNGFSKMTLEVLGPVGPKLLVGSSIRLNNSLF